VFPETARCIQLADLDCSVYSISMEFGANPVSAQRQKTAAVLLSMVLFLIVLKGPIDLFAQTKMGRLVVVLVDASGKFIPGVEVLLQSGETHIQQKNNTDASGEVFFRGLPFGAYLITIDDSRFEQVRESLSIASQVSKEVRFELKIHPLEQSVIISDLPSLIDPQKTNSSLYQGEDQIQRRSVSLPNRDAINMVASMPGWVLENNGVLHPRGSEYQTQYVLDGIPVLENRSPAFASGPMLDSSESFEVMTGGIPAEYGRKLGGSSMSLPTLGMI
jgi:carboxypeptidase family protein